MTTPAREQDESFIRQTIALAMRGRGDVEPNPMVGCVLVKNGRVIGEGHHQKFGDAHAEPNALASCAESPKGATAYVTLEPCCHTGKKTPPCAPRLIHAKLARVVIGCLDPNPQVNGNGATMLRDAGIAVEVGVLESECKQLNAAFFARSIEHRPYVTLKWAQSADGRIAGPRGARMRISGEASHRTVHQLRARCDAILVGINTLLRDDPLLTVREVPVRRTLHRFVLDRDLRIPLSSRLVATTGDDAPLTVFCGEQALTGQSPKAAALAARGVAVHSVPLDSSGELSLRHCLRAMDRRFTHLLVEPGPTLARSFLDANLADRLWIFRSPRSIPHADAPAAAKFDHPPIASTPCGEDVLTEYLNPSGQAFFHPSASADFILISNPRGRTLDDRHSIT